MSMQLFSFGHPCEHQLHRTCIGGSSCPLNGYPDAWCCSYIKGKINFKRDKPCEGIRCRWGFTHPTQQQFDEVTQVLNESRAIALTIDEADGAKVLSFQIDSPHVIDTVQCALHMMRHPPSSCAKGVGQLLAYAAVRAGDTKVFMQLLKTMKKPVDGYILGAYAFLVQGSASIYANCGSASAAAGAVGAGASKGAKKKEKAEKKEGLVDDLQNILVDVMNAALSLNGQLVYREDQTVLQSTLLHALAQFPKSNKKRHEMLENATQMFRDRPAPTPAAAATTTTTPAAAAATPAATTADDSSTAKGEKEEEAAVVTQNAIKDAPSSKPVAAPTTTPTPATASAVEAPILADSSAEVSGDKPIRPSASQRIAPAMPPEAIATTTTAVAPAVLPAAPTLASAVAPSSSSSSAAPSSVAALLREVAGGADVSGKQIRDQNGLIRSPASTAPPVVIPAEEITPSIISANGSTGTTTANSTTTTRGAGKMATTTAGSAVVSVPTTTAPVVNISTSAGALPGSGITQDGGVRIGGGVTDGAAPLGDINFFTTILSPDRSPTTSAGAGPTVGMLSSTAASSPHASVSAAMEMYAAGEQYPLSREAFVANMLGVSPYPWRQEQGIPRWDYEERDGEESHAFDSRYPQHKATYEAIRANCPWSSLYLCGGLFDIHQEMTDRAPLGTLATRTDHPSFSNHSVEVEADSAADSFYPRLDHPIPSPYRMASPHRMASPRPFVHNRWACSSESSNSMHWHSDAFDSEIEMEMDLDIEGYGYYDSDST